MALCFANPVAAEVRDAPVAGAPVGEDRADPLTGRGLSGTEPDGMSEAVTTGAETGDTAPAEAESSVEEATEEALGQVLSSEEAAALAEVDAQAGAEDAPLEAAEQAARDDAAEAALDSGAVVEDLDALDWHGAWRSFWRGGQALLTLQQDGTAITGSYQPGDGVIEGQIDGILMRGTWRQPGADGVFEFAMAPDGASFVGRFGNGEYWNGVRMTEGGLSAALFGQKTPQAAFASFVSAQNAARDGDAVAEIVLRRFLTFADSEDNSLRAQNARVDALNSLVDLASIRLMSVPEQAEGLEAQAILDISGTEFTFPLTIAATAPETWAVVVPTLEELDAIRTGILEATGAPSIDDLRADRRYSPRQAVEDFLRGAETWHSGGDRLVMDTLDLSEIPEGLRASDGPIAAEYLRQILSRLGHSVRQEIPNDPERREPVLIYENVGGTIELDRYPQEDGSVRWLFTAPSIGLAPAIFQAMQNLPLADGVQPSEPFTSAFALRAQVREISPRLLKRQFILENWQWLALAVALVGSLIAAFVLSRILRMISRRVLRWNSAEPDTVRMMDHVVGWPVIIFAVGGALTLVVRRLGMRQDVSEVANVFASVLLVIGGTYFFYYLVSAVSTSLARSARSTETTIDDIAAVIGGGVAKIGVLIGGVIALAELLSLPYEGVIAALGVGGLAFAIAARDGVANLIGAGILMADRPFKKGDYVSVGGVEGTVEDVGMRSTRLRTADDAVITVPNAQIAEGQVNNMGQRRRRQLTMTLGLTYDTPRAKLQRFIDRLNRMLEDNPLVLPDHRVALDNFGPSSIDIDLLAYLNTADIAAYATAKHDLIGDIIDLAADVGVEFAFPSQTVYVARDKQTDLLHAVG